MDSETWKIPNKKNKRIKSILEIDYNLWKYELLGKCNDMSNGGRKEQIIEFIIKFKDADIDTMKKYLKVNPIHILENEYLIYLHESCKYENLVMVKKLQEIYIYKSNKFYNYINYLLKCNNIEIINMILNKISDIEHITYIYNFAINNFRRYKNITIINEIYEKYPKLFCQSYFEHNIKFNFEMAKYIYIKNINNIIIHDYLFLQTKTCWPYYYYNKFHKSVINFNLEHGQWFQSIKPYLYELKYDENEKLIKLCIRNKERKCWERKKNLLWYSSGKGNKTNILYKMCEDASRYIISKFI